MLKPDAYSFSKAISDIWLVETICDQSADLQMDDKQVLDTRQKVNAVLQNIRQICIGSDLDDRIGPEILRFQTALKKEPLKKIAHRCDHLKERILDELTKEFYFHVSRDDGLYYGQEAPFGNAIATKFEVATDDIKQAAKCLAFRQSTACVFHLMRAMESVVRQLARKLKMTIMLQTTWRQMTGNMDAQIKKMKEKTGKQKQKKNNWEAARVNLHHLGSVLRNNTMHPASIYTQDEAKHIFNAVRVSMTTLCDL